jgi:hypothetical protein
MERKPDRKPGKVLRGVLLFAVLLAVVVVLCAACGDFTDLYFPVVQKGMTQAQVEALLGRPEYLDTLDDLAAPAAGKVGEWGSGWFYSPRWPLGKELIVEWDSTGRVRNTILLP